MWERSAGPWSTHPSMWALVCRGVSGHTPIGGKPFFLSLALPLFPLLLKKSVLCEILWEKRLNGEPSRKKMTPKYEFQYNQK